MSDIDDLQHDLDTVIDHNIELQVENKQLRDQLEIALTALSDCEDSTDLYEAIHFAKSALTQIRELHNQTRDEEKIQIIKK